MRIVNAASGIDAGGQGEARRALRERRDTQQHRGRYQYYATLAGCSQGNV